MRKTICTATLFVPMLAAFVALFVVQVPMRAWWSSTFGDGVDVPLIIWSIFNIIGPVSFLVVGCFTVYGFWNLASRLCSSLRRGMRQGAK